MIKNRGFQVTKGKPTIPVVQAVTDSKEEAKFYLFGELETKKILPIEEACAKCIFWKGRFDNIKACQKCQGGDAIIRGFSTVICPEQFIEESPLPPKPKVLGIRGENL